MNYSTRESASKRAIQLPIHHCILQPPCLDGVEEDAAACTALLDGRYAANRFGTEAVPRHRRSRSSQPPHLILFLLAASRRLAETCAAPGAAKPCSFERCSAVPQNPSDVGLFHPQGFPVRSFSTDPNACCNLRLSPLLGRDSLLQC